MNEDEFKADAVNGFAYLGNCRGCGHPMEAPEEEIHNGPRNEIFLACTMLGTPDCVTGEWFLIRDLI